MKNIVISIIVGLSVIFVGLTRYPVGKQVPAEIYTAVSDPCDQILQFLVPTDPNWARDYGDNERTRIILNVSANRGMALQSRKILAEVAKRLIALEKRFDPNDPNWVFNTPIDPNEVKE